MILQGLRGLRHDSEDSGQDVECNNNEFCSGAWPCRRILELLFVFILYYNILAVWIIELTQFYKNLLIS